MHLQQSVEGYDVFARSLSIGPETMVMKFRPELPMHDRYAVAHDFLTPGRGDEVVTISRLVNAFFRWEFNSCEILVAGAEVHPIDYANACPDVALTSLHYYFPWAMAALLRWTVFCVVTGREPRLDLDIAATSTIADRDDLSYADKLAGYRRLADELLRDRAVPRLLRHPAAPRRRGGARLGRQRRTSTRCWSRRSGTYPAARARPVRRALPRPGRDVGARREGGRSACSGGQPA